MFSVRFARTISSSKDELAVRVESAAVRQPICEVGGMNQSQANAWTFFGPVAGMVLWAVICSVAWSISTRDDYAHLAVARACYSVAAETRAGDSRCGGIGPPDAYMGEVNRKARISRLAAAGGA